MSGLARTFNKALLLCALLALAAGCTTYPQKYRKKRGCDCPHWDQLPRRVDGVRASISPHGQEG